MASNKKTKKVAPKPASNTKTSKKKTVKKKVVKKNANKKITIKKTAAKKSPVKKATGKIKVTLEQRHKMICEAAYYISLEKTYETVNPTEDWLQAEAAIDKICTVHSK